MDTSKRSFIREARENGTGMDGLVDGLAFYTDRFLDVINDGNPVDIPLIVAALIHTSTIMKESAPYKMSKFSPMLTELMLRRFRPKAEETRAVIPKAVLDKLRDMKKLDDDAGGSQDGGA